MKIPMNIPQGYKSSPLGIIPKDWEVKRLGEVCSVNRGIRVTRSDLNADWEYPVFQNTDSPLGFYNKFNVNENNPFLILGGSAGLIGFCNTKFWAADDCAYFGDSDHVNKQFLYLTLLFHAIEIKNYVRGGNIPRIDRKSLEDMKLLLPPLAEQERIAELLGTWDRAIEMQKQLIDKLELRKKGLMQQLLTGKKRLPGFTGEWKEIVLKDISNITIGEFVHKKFQNPNGKYPVYNGGITETGYYDYSNQKGGQIVISARGAGGGFINKVDCDYWAGNSSYSVDVNNAHFDWIYVYLYMKSKQSILDGNKQQGGGVPSVNKSQVENFIIKYPPTKEEQSAIAHVFSALDYEIQKLAEKRDKYIEEKKGLMQVLLTGKKRISLS